MLNVPTPLSTQISRAFYRGEMDLRARPKAPRPGWASMPECRAVATLEARGASGSEVRRLLTLVSALDRARDADRLWDAAAQLHAREGWAFRPGEVAARTEVQLGEVLRAHGVSQRHGPDTDAWRRIALALASRDIAPAVFDAIEDGKGSVDGLLSGLRARDSQGRPLFPMLGGPKISRMWIRMLAAPGGARIEGLEALPVAVDVQVLKVTKYLGLLSVDGTACVGPTRDAVQAVWRAGVAAGGTEGPSELGSSCASLDPALWFFGKWGCTHRERAGRRVPVAPICAACGFKGPTAGVWGGGGG